MSQSIDRQSLWDTFQSCLYGQLCSTPGEIAFSLLRVYAALRVFGKASALTMLMFVSSSTYTNEIGIAHSMTELSECNLAYTASKACPGRMLQRVYDLGSRR